MATVKLKSCEIEGDLAAAVLDIQQDIGDSVRSTINDLDQISLQAPETDQINTLLDQLAMGAPIPQSPQTIAFEIGIPNIDASTAEEEERIEQLGLILLNGIGRVADGSGNIEDYRRLYFAVGADRTKFLQYVQGTDTLLIVQTHLTVKKLPFSPVAWTPALARTALQNPAIEQIYSAADEQQYCVVPSFLAVNKSRDQVALEFSVPKREILTQVFWLREILQDAATVSRLEGFGLTGQEISVALSGQRFIEVRPAATQQIRGLAGEKTSRAIAQLRLLQSRFALLDTPSKIALKFEALQSSDQARDHWWELQRAVRFYSTLLERPEDISDFLAKNPPADLDYLFGTRRTVTGINFQADIAILLRTIQQVLNVQSGSTTVPTLLVNRDALLVDHEIDNANASICRNECALVVLSDPNVQYGRIVLALACLQSSLDTAPLPTPRTVPQIGYVSFDSPASILMHSMDWVLTLGIDESIKKLEDAILSNPLLKGLTSAVQAIAQVLRDAQNGIDQIFNHYRDVVEADLSKLHETLSKYTAFVGTVAIDSSILKCSLGYGIKASIPSLDELQGLIETLRRKLKNILAKLVQAISKFLETVLCAPLNIINGLLNKVESFLPEFCQVARVPLPPDIEAVMAELRQKFQMQNSTVQAFSRDLIRISAVLQGAPAKLEQFKKGLACESPAKDRFFKALNVNVGSSQVGIPNPTGVIANQINKLTPGF